METISRLSPSTTLDHLNMTSSSAPSFLKLEDLHNSSPPPSTSYDDGSMTATPPPVIVHSKPAKKRKSWGQELPEPKTSLPPRKRAKTDDEKEQRRIERIKRNRAAAHNSRERKRQETETLAVALARANAELDAYRKHFGALPANVVLPEVTLSIDSADTPAPSLIESSRGSIDAAASPATPEDDDLFDYPIIKEEPAEMAFSTTVPPAFDNAMDMETKPALPQLDQTQHSAVMLCGLQCRSTRRSSSSNPRSSQRSVSPSSASWWSSLFLSLMTLHLQTSYKTLLLALWTTSPSRVTRLMQASTRRLTSPSTTSSTTTQRLPLPSTLAVAQLNAATGRVTTQQQGALPSVAALQRRFLVEVHRRSTAKGLAAQRRRTRSDSIMALREQQRRDQNGDAGRDDGVGRPMR